MEFNYTSLKIPIGNIGKADRAYHCSVSGAAAGR